MLVKYDTSSHLPFTSLFALQHRPYANQINLGVCCSIPEELNKYVKENNIQLLTHSDPIGTSDEDPESERLSFRLF